MLGKAGCYAELCKSEGFIGVDFLNEEDEPTYEDRNYNITVNDSDKRNIIVSGNFWYSDCDGSCDYVLRTLKTNHFFMHNTVSTRMEERYNNDI